MGLKWKGIWYNKLVSKIAENQTHAKVSPTTSRRKMAQFFALEYPQEELSSPRVLGQEVGFQ